MTFPLGDREDTARRATEITGETTIVLDVAGFVQGRVEGGRERRSWCSPLW